MHDATNKACPVERRRRNACMPIERCTCTQINYTKCLKSADGEHKWRRHRSCYSDYTECEACGVDEENAKRAPAENERA